MKTLKAYLIALWKEPEILCYADKPFSEIVNILGKTRTSKEEIKIITDDILGDAHLSHDNGPGKHPFNTTPEYLVYRVEALLDSSSSLPTYTLKTIMRILHLGVLSQKRNESRAWARLLPSLMYSNTLPPAMLLEHLTWIEENIPEDDYGYKASPRMLPSKYSCLLGVLHAKKIYPEVLAILCTNKNKSVREEALKNPSCPPEAKALVVLD